MKKLKNMFFGTLAVAAASLLAPGLDANANANNSDMCCAEMIIFPDEESGRGEEAIYCWLTRMVSDFKGHTACEYDCGDAGYFYCNPGN